MLRDAACVSQRVAHSRSDYYGPETPVWSPTLLSAVVVSPPSVNFLRYAAGPRNDILIHLQAQDLGRTLHSQNPGPIIEALSCWPFTGGVTEA